MVKKKSIVMSGLDYFFPLHVKKKRGGGSFLSYCLRLVIESKEQLKCKRDKSYLTACTVLVS